MKKIRFSNHSKEQLKFRGTTEAEITEAIQQSEWRRADLISNRMECRKDFEFNSEWNKKSYKTKQVRPIFIEEAEEIVIITVYTYYF